MIYDKPILISKYFSLYGRSYYKDDWNDDAIKLIKGFPDKGQAYLRKYALKIKSLIRKNLWDDVERIEVSDNGRTFYEFHGHLDYFDFEESTCVERNGDVKKCRVLLKKDHFLNIIAEHELFNKETPNSVLQKYKNILVSEAILKHLHFVGEPQNNEVLVQIILTNFEKTFNKPLDPNMVRENVKRMVSFWKLHKP